LYIDKISKAIEPTGMAILLPILFENIPINITFRFSFTNPKTPNMMRKQRTTFVCLFLLVLFFITNACQPEVSNTSETTAMCVWHKGSVRSAPSREADWLSSLSLGEQVSYSGEAAIDSADKNRLYYHVGLPDGTKGWASEFVLLPEAVPGVLLQRSKLFSSPDSASASFASVNRLDFVAVDEQQAYWVHVVSPRMAKEGWVPRERVSLKQEEVSVGLAYRLAMKKRDTLTQLMLLKRLRAHQPTGATFRRDLIHKIESYQ
jgi:hypothetical protein